MKRPTDYEMAVDSWANLVTKYPWLKDNPRLRLEVISPGSLVDGKVVYTPKDPVDESKGGGPLKKDLEVTIKIPKKHAPPFHSVRLGMVVYDVELDADGQISIRLVDEALCWSRPGGIP